VSVRPSIRTVNPTTTKCVSGGRGEATEGFTECYMVISQSHFYFLRAEIVFRAHISRLYEKFHNILKAHSVPSQNLHTSLNFLRTPISPLYKL
jgi:hypothetical protein